MPHTLAGNKALKKALLRGTMILNNLLIRPYFFGSGWHPWIIMNCYESHHGPGRSAHFVRDLANAGCKGCSQGGRLRGWISSIYWIRWPDHCGMLAGSSPSCFHGCNHVVAFKRLNFSFQKQGEGQQVTSSYQFLAIVHQTCADGFVICSSIVDGRRSSWHPCV